MNKISIVGRLTKDPELKTIGSGIQTCKFNVASRGKRKSESGDIKVDFFTCVAWKEKAGHICEYCCKGDMLHVMGSMESRNFTKNDGTNQTSWETTVEDIEFLTPKKEREANRSASNESKRSEQATIEEYDDNLPF